MSDDVEVAAVRPSSAEAAAPWVASDGTEYFDDTGIEEAGYRQAVSRKIREIARGLENWSSGIQNSGLDAFTTPTNNPYSVFRACRNAMRDDVVSGVEESTRALAIQRMRFSSGDRRGVDRALELWADEIDLQSAVDSMMRELYVYSQTVVAVEWGVVTVKESLEAKGRKNSHLQLPSRIATLDPLCVVPYSGDIFGEWKLAWHLDAGKAFELRQMGRSLNEGIFDGWVDEGDVTFEERSRLGDLGVDIRNLVRLNPDNVFRITDNAASYERFGEPPLRTIFPQISLKSELMRSDSVGLRGTANYILLVRQGTDERPALSPELDALRENFTRLAKVPIIVSDHRLSVEILTPNTQFTLDPARYDLLDARIASRLLRSNDVASGDGDSGGQLRSRTISQALQHRRDKVLRLLNQLLRESVPSSEPLKVEFMPGRVIVDNGSLIANVMQNARDRRIVSRETALEFLDLSQDVEAARIKAEEAKYGEVFNEQVPFNSPQNDGQTGRPAGGGDASKNKATPKSGAGGTKKEAS